NVRLPPFMRRAHPTCLTLRSPLADLDPLVNASKPVARKLGPSLDQARALAHDAKPTVRDLSVAIRRRGRNNDLIDFLHSVPPLESIAVETRKRSYAPGGHNVNVGTTLGSFQEAAKALPHGATEFSYARPYSTD